MIERLFILFVKNRLVIGFILFVATLLLLFFTLATPSRLGDSELYNYDKLGHFMLFFIWTFIFGLFMISLKNEHASLLFIFITGSVFGITIEILQGIVPFDRNPNIYDAIADVAGSLTAAIMLLVVKKKLFVAKMKE